MSAEKSPPSPTLPEVIEGSFPGNADLWIGNPAARARRGLKGQSSYKAALGDFPLDEDNLLVTASWVEWPQETYVPFSILFDWNDGITFNIYLDGGTASLIHTKTGFDFKYIRLTLVGRQKLNVTIKDLKINGYPLGIYRSKGGYRTWFFHNINTLPFPYAYISGKVNFSETGARKFFHQIPRFDIVFGS